MAEVGAFEAKTHLPKLLARVQNGERPSTAIRSPSWCLVPYRQREPEKIGAAIDNLQAFQQTHSLGGLSIREMIDEGRKY